MSLFRRRRKKKDAPPPPLSITLRVNVVEGDSEEQARKLATLLKTLDSLHRSLDGAGLKLEDPIFGNGFIVYTLAALDDKRDVFEEFEKQAKQAVRAFHLKAQL